ncbi:MAG: HlyD family efflux transporter periplasmic adaptor subunit [Gammaproteobacteria bacterium]|jgi:HlyD family secretion protein|nr:HlyD family efflux transporter periplasmic adaptor subunit [Gammaproteobacteria bacterium]|tara:strand:- start:396 stop:1358 length:963 start_codon:yes stop_codon:yes gene_type:complete
MFKNSVICALLLFALTACEEEALTAVGQLESDRIELVAEFSEPITAISVIEGDQLSPGDLVVSQDSSRVDIRITEAQANIARIQALLAEQISGPRQELIDAAKASLSEATIDQEFAIKEVERLVGLRERDLTSIESVDQAEQSKASAGARIEFAQARLDELEAGTRVEQIDQTRRSMDQAEAQLASLELDRQRLSITAPANAIVDSLPFEVGERPRQGDVVAVLLSGAQPYARIYIPEQLRVGMALGTELQIHVDGLPNLLTGRIRRIASEASFTPYFALTERDRDRLSYVAEVALPELPNRLPDGVPVQVVFDSGSTNE